MSGRGIAWVKVVTFQGRSIIVMQVFVGFDDEQVDFELTDDRLVAAWRGPLGVQGLDAAGLVTQALENPVDYPPLRQAVAPGDRVVIALGTDLPEASEVVNAVTSVLQSAGVDPESITIVTSSATIHALKGHLAPGLNVRAHDPDDREGLAYLAATSGDRRVYLNRLMTDADFVLPIGRLSFDPTLGYRGPWSAIFPDLSDSETQGAYLAGASDAAPARDQPRSFLKESAEVSWLLGCQFQLGIVPGVTGVLKAVAGLASAVIDQGARDVDDSWTVRVDSRAELVIVGIGSPGRPGTLDDLGRGLALASLLVQRGGKIIALSRVGGEFGPAFQRLIVADDARNGLSALRGHERDHDYAAARQFAQAIAWADVYLLSALDPDALESLSIIPLDRPEEARRLAALTGSCLVVSQADEARAVVADENG